MKQIIAREISYLKEKFHKKLPTNQQFYIKEDLDKAGFPLMLSKRITHLSISAFRDEVSLPQTDWTDLNDPFVLDKWEAFMASAEIKVRVPANRMQETLESALGDILHLLTGPQAFLPDYIFGKENSLMTAELLRRCKKIVAYKYFAAFVRKYVDRKKLDVLTKEQFSSVITALDQKLTAGYGALDWAALMKPLFELYEGQVQATLFSRFFADKGLKISSGKFKHITGTVSRDLFIETLSLPDSEDDDEAETIDHEPEEINIIDPGIDSDLQDAETEKTEQETQLDESAEQPAAKKEPELPAEMKDPEPGQQGNEKDDEDDEDEPLYKIHQIKEETGDWNGDEPETRPDKTLSGEKAEDDEEDEPIYSMFRSSGKDKNEPPVEPEEENDQDEDEIPIWKSFSRDDDDDNAIPIRQETAEDTDDENSEDKFKRIKTFELPVPDDARQQLQEQLAEKRDDYIKHIFSGDESAFEYTIEQLAEFRNWREAGKYLTKEVFKRNTIDMYSDSAVDFTDQLHKFFIARDR